MSATKRDKHLLIGNGFSIGFHAEFNYKTLFEVASLTDTEKKLFGEFHDFEKTLSNLSEARKVIEILIKNPKAQKNIKNHINSIKKKLIESISKIHPTNLQSLLRKDKIEKYIDTFDEFKSIYTLNYDLLLYWILMNSRSNERKNDKYKWRDGFRNNKGLLCWPGNKGVNFFNLHGSLYFIKSSLLEFELEKLKWDESSTILQKVDEKINSNALPVYVCEGTSQEKMNHVLHSNYLSFSFEKFEAIEGELYLYGVSLDDNDAHIWNAVSNNKNIEKIYISYHEDQERIEKIAKKWFKKLYEKNKVVFFSSGIDSLKKQSEKT